MSVKQFFVPKDPGGVFIEADYRQLEIRVLALATMCPKLIKDINDGVDLHRFFASQIYKKAMTTVTDAERKLAKGFSFQLQYGASAKSISEFWGADINLVKSFIKAYYKRYPEVKVWQDNNIQLVKDRSEWLGTTRSKDSQVVSVKSSIIPSIWPQDWGAFHLDETIYEPNRPAVFPGTQIKNYPIQGGAADIMSLMLNNIRQTLLVQHAEQLSFSNTVHDSFLFEAIPFYDEPMEYQVASLAAKIKKHLETVPKLLELTYGITSPIPFPVDIAVGQAWGNMLQLDI